MTKAWWIPIVGGLVGLVSAGPSTAAPLAVSHWTDCYVGLNASYVLAYDATTDAPFVQGPFAGSGASWNTVGPPYEVIHSQANGPALGGEAGCDQQPGGGSYVIGAAVDLTDFFGLTLNGKSSISTDTLTSATVNWIGSARARIGVPDGNVLFYLTGGVALGGINARAYDLTATPSPGMMDVNNGGLALGWVAGLGAEWMVSDNTALSLEYLHYGFPGATATGKAKDPPDAYPRFINDIGIDQIRVGAKWHM